MNARCLYLFVRLLACIPLPVLYFFSDLICPLVHLLYRKKIVRQNIEASFPEKSKQERRSIERRFYHYFCDIIQEIIHLSAMKPQELKRRLAYRNPELLQRLQEEGKLVLVYLGHYGNWEYQQIKVHVPELRMMNVYRPLKNKAFDALMLSLRGKYGAENVSKKMLLRKLVELKRAGQAAVFGMIADQSPSKNNLYYWTSFLNQDTAILTGVERMAKKMDCAVVFAHISVVGRGRYETEFRLICEDASAMAEYEITEKYARMMEENILQDPAYWLWTHKRWKYKPSDKS